MSTIVAFFNRNLNNHQSGRGDKAKQIKAELKFLITQNKQHE
jgi:hypothetical protein